jgi:hypothetical protein
MKVVFVSSSTGRSNAASYLKTVLQMFMRQLTQINYLMQPDSGIFYASFIKDLVTPNVNKK